MEADADAMSASELAELTTLTPASSIPALIASVRTVVGLVGEQDKRLLKFSKALQEAITASTSSEIMSLYLRRRLARAIITIALLLMGKSNAKAATEPENTGTAMGPALSTDQLVLPAIMANALHAAEEDGSTNLTS